ncbi:MAG: thermonuclease family protein [Myxococcaceae bacterium]
MRAAAAALCLGLAACAGEPPCGPASAVVEDVVDGDTVLLTSGGKVRYLLVDAPETTGGKSDCYGSQARDFNRSKVMGKTVSLRYDPAGCTDRFGRTLAYVTVDGEEVNRLMISGGFGCVLVVPPAGTAREAEFKDLESVARTERVGLWGACTQSPCSR